MKFIYGKFKILMVFFSLFLGTYYYYSQNFTHFINRSKLTYYLSSAFKGEGGVIEINLTDNFHKYEPTYYEQISEFISLIIDTMQNHFLLDKYFFISILSEMYLNLRIFLGC